MSSSFGFGKPPSSSTCTTERSTATSTKELSTRSESRASHVAFARVAWSGRFARDSVLPHYQPAPAVDSPLCSVIQVKAGMRMLLALIPLLIAFPAHAQTDAALRAFPFTKCVKRVTLSGLRGNALFRCSFARNLRRPVRAGTSRSSGAHRSAR